MDVVAIKILSLRKIMDVVALRVKDINKDLAVQMIWWRKRCQCVKDNFVQKMLLSNTCYLCHIICPKDFITQKIV